MICKAPSNNMYFNVSGQVSPCWKLPGYVDNWSHERSIKDIWFGEHFKKYRDALSKNIFLDRCKECEKEIKSGVWPLAKAYEEFPVQKYPSLLELELSNRCNLECVMCSPKLSSGLAKKMGLPLLEPYDDTFKEQLKEFYPHLTELRFNGGEPFAQQIVLDICEDVAKIAPDLPISIATNGTVMNKVVRHLMDVCNLKINISIDSLIPERYAKIRVNGNLNKVLKNFEVFKEYCTKYNRNLCIMVNPMRNNWEEMPHFVDFCQENNVNLWYNTVLYPPAYAIHNLPKEELSHIYDSLRIQVQKRKNLGQIEWYKLEHLVEDQIKNWVLDSYEKDI